MSIDRNDGGPAYPSRRSHEHFQYAETSFEGMSLRDYFAGQAMDRIVQNTDERRTTPFYASVIAQNAYAIADAMLAERKAAGGK